MERYAIWEGFMDKLEKKVATIQKKCQKYGCDFHFAKVGEEIRPVEQHYEDEDGNPKVRQVNCKFIICEAEGTAQVNGWKFVASIEHTEKGNIFHKALTDVEIPERYRFSDTYCEHCKTIRHRKGTDLIMNEETGEFKQVGFNCLMDYTHGMSASWAAYMASLETIFKEAEEESFGGFCGGWYQRYFSTTEILQFAAEVIRKYGYSKETKGLTTEFFDVYSGNTTYWRDEEIRRVRQKMEDVGFNPESEESAKMVKDALEWLDGQEAKNDYMHNLKVATALDHTDYGKFGLLVSLFPTWNRELEVEAKKKAEKEAGKQSQHVGKVGDRITVQVESIKCLTSWESAYGHNGYYTVTTYVYKIVGKDGNVYTWKTQNWMDEDRCPQEIKGTVKEHKEFREVKQTELTRCKITKAWQKPEEPHKEAADTSNYFNLDWLGEA